jgi:hypothetical protein
MLFLFNDFKTSVSMCFDELHGEAKAGHASPDDEDIRVEVHCAADSAWS